MKNTRIFIAIVLAMPLLFIQYDFAAALFYTSPSSHIEKQAAEEHQGNPSPAPRQASEAIETSTSARPISTLTPPPVSSPEKSGSKPPAAPSSSYTVIKVVDGDTIDASIDGKTRRLTN